MGRLSKCLYDDCKEPAEWRVWYGNCVVSVGGGNIAYNCMCLKHVVHEMEHGRGGFPVACVKNKEIQDNG